MIEQQTKTLQEYFQEIAKANFSLWNEMLQTLDPDRVAEMYLDDCSFLPTLSPDLKCGYEDARGYFEHFLLKRPSGKITNERIHPLDDYSYIHAGMYDFKVKNSDGSFALVPARFTFLWKKVGPDWKILHHHSSVLPN